MPTTAREVYAEAVRALPLTERLVWRRSFWTNWPIPTWPSWTRAANGVRKTSAT